MISIEKNIENRHNALNIEIIKDENSKIIFSVYENNKLYENTLISDSIFQVDNIYVGRIEKIVPSLSYSFVNIGYKKNAFMPLVEKESFELNNSKKIKQGDKVLVQIKKEAYDDKGPFVTRDIRIPGNLVMYMPFNNYVTVSNRINNISSKNRLINIGRKLSKNKFGIVFRKNAEDASINTIEKELRDKIDIFNKIDNTYSNISPPYCIYSNNDIIINEIYEYSKLNKDIHIKTNMYDIYTRILNLDINKVNIEYCSNIISKPFSITKSGSTIQLEDGSNVIVDFCKALTVFDVNSNDTSINKDKTFMDINMLALEEISRQIRLNNISGIILIDLLKMNNEQNEVLLNFASKLFDGDIVATNIHGFTKTGLMEITRKRIKSAKYDFEK